MAFWGVEVKPGEPIIHSCEKARGRLRISGATMGRGQGSCTTVLQCSVGNRKPVWLCILQAYKKESCRLDVEFEEADDVVFSVIGPRPRSIYLTGYYVQRNHQSNSRSDTESYGVDIENTQTDGSGHHSDDDMYEDSFINDNDEIKVSPQSPVSSSKGIDEVMMENDKPKERKGRHKKLKKKCQVIESVNDANSHEYEDQDGSLSVLKSKTAEMRTVSDAGEKIAQLTKKLDYEAKDDGLCGSELKQKDDDPFDGNSHLQGEKEPSLDEQKTQVNEEKHELPEEETNLEKIIVSIHDAIHGNNTQDTSIIQNLPVSDGKDQLPSIDLAKPKKKRKGRSAKEDKTSKVQTDSEGHSECREDNRRQLEASTNLGFGEMSSVTYPELGSVNGQKSTKRRKELSLEGLLAVGLDGKCHNIPKEDIPEQRLLHTDGMIKDLQAENGEAQVKWGALQLLSHLCGEYEDQRLEETSTKEIGGKCHTMPRQDEVMQEPHVEISTEDVTAANSKNQDQQIDNNITTKSEILADDKQLDKKIKKKKKKKSKGEIGLNASVIDMTDNEVTTPTKHDDQTAETTPLQRRILSNGLIIEELASGQLNGKVAVPGKRVKIHYTAMLKDNGHVFDSTVGKAACKFRLGDEEFIDGLNVGIEGMCVGDKRRLTIPPSMGFGDAEVENVPPNSWLVYDIELVSVFR